jgi:hypothetical protein
MDIAKYIFDIVSTVALVLVTIFLGVKANKFSKQANDLTKLSYQQQKEIQDTQIKLTLFNKRYEVYSFLTKEILEDGFFQNQRNHGRCYEYMMLVDFLFNRPEAEQIQDRIIILDKAFDSKKFLDMYTDISNTDEDIARLKKEIDKIIKSVIIKITPLFEPYLTLIPSIEKAENVTTVTKPNKTKKANKTRPQKALINDRDTATNN